jgi:hypothetical protein
MVRTSVLFAAAAITVAGITFSAFGDDNTPKDSSNTQQTQQPAADKAADASNPNDATASKQAPDADAIRKTVATATEAAVTKGGFGDVVDRFVDADQTRLKDASKQKYDDLDAKIDQFRQDWKAKYNQDFNISSDRNNILGDSFARISQGEIGEARTAGGKEVPSDEPKVVAGTAEDLKKAGANQTDLNSNKTFGGDTNRESGRNIAAMIIPASHGEAEVDVPLIHELPDSWKIDLPDSVDGAKLHDNLLKQITSLDDAKDKWPSDVNDAYRDVTHHVMEAMFESTATNASGTTPPAGSQ